MKYFVISILFHFLVILPCTKVNAGVAEASTGEKQTIAKKYDLSGLTPEEKKWFVTFLEGTFYADGWNELSDDILVKISPEDRERKSLVLTQLGNKIGREWCRDNDIRRINTDMLKKWGKMLRSTASDEPHLLVEVLENINGEVDSIID